MQWVGNAVGMECSYAGQGMRLCSGEGKRCGQSWEPACSMRITTIPQSRRKQSFVTIEFAKPLNMRVWGSRFLVLGVKILDARIRVVWLREKSQRLSHLGSARKSKNQNIKF